MYRKFCHNSWKAAWVTTVTACVALFTIIVVIVRIYKFFLLSRIQNMKDNPNFIFSLINLNELSSTMFSDKLESCAVLFLCAFTI